MKYGLLGKTLEHSYSKIIHEQLGDYEYELLSLSPSDFSDFMNKRAFKGLNVTIPYKVEVMKFCDYISPLAQEIGAVNTLYFDDQGCLHGTNTDYSGFLYAVDEAGLSVANKNVLILGDGATHKTIKKALQDRGAKKILVASRKIQTEAIITNDSKGITLLNYDQLANHQEIEIVINATPVGMYPNITGRPVDLSIFPKCTGVFDVVYNPCYTNLLKQAIELNIPYGSGLDMLVAQATAAAGYFMGKEDFYKKENKRIIQELKRQLKQQTGQF